MFGLYPASIYFWENTGAKSSPKGTLMSVALTQPLFHRPRSVTSYSLKPAREVDVARFENYDHFSGGDLYRPSIASER